MTNNKDKVSNENQGNEEGVTKQIKFKILVVVDVICGLIVIHFYLIFTFFLCFI